MTMPPKKDTAPLPEDLRVFLTVVRKGGFAAAAEELGLSPAYVSKRIQILETTLGSRLLHRTSRRIALTDDGERVQRWAVRSIFQFGGFEVHAVFSEGDPVFAHIAGF